MLPVQRRERPWLLLYLILLFLNASFVRADDGYGPLVDWILSRGGRVEERVSTNHFDDEGIRGMVALRDLEPGTELLFCPWKLVIGSRESLQSDADMCRVVNDLKREFDLGEDSSIWPYLNSMELPRLPASWEPSVVQELQGLPPSGNLKRHEEWYLQNCGSDATLHQPTTQQALVAFISRVSSVGMIPLYDMFNHHNGLQNVKLVLTQEGATLRTTIPVAKGQQLYMSYGLRPASQMFRDYAFVDSWPSLWSWKLSDSSSSIVVLFPDGVAAIHPSVDFLQAIWDDPSRSLPEWQQYATHHTRSLSSLALRQFCNSATSLLNSLPTTWQDDEQILSKEEETNLDRDRMEAIRYRLVFKKAVADSLAFAKRALGEETATTTTM